MEGKNVLVVGGGPAGVRAALEEAATGGQVTLVERFPTLGAERIPRDRLITPEEAFVNPDLERVREHKDIRVLTYNEYLDGFAFPVLTWVLKVALIPVIGYFVFFFASVGVEGLRAVVSVPGKLDALLGAGGGEKEEEGDE